MKHLLPDRVELFVLIIASIVLACFSFMAKPSEIYFAVFSVPLTITAAMMGIRRHWRMTEAREEQTVEVDRAE